MELAEIQKLEDLLESLTGLVESPLENIKEIGRQFEQAQKALQAVSEIQFIGQREFNRYRKSLLTVSKTFLKRLPIEQARCQTEEAVQKLDAIENMLNRSLEKGCKFEWDSLKDKTEFNTKKPMCPNLIDIPEKPRETSEKYRPKLRFIDKVFSFEERRVEEARFQFNNDLEDWIKIKKEVTNKNNNVNKKFLSEIKKWQAERNNFLEQQKEKNDSIEQLKKQYFLKEPEAVLEYYHIVLSLSDYPDYFPQEFDLDYNPETQILIVDYSLPCADDLPNLREVKYVQSREEFKEVFLPESAVNKMFDSLVYQIPLRTILEIYESDAANAIDSIVFNGWVESIDRSTGQDVKACILSVQMNREEFLSINLANIDPKLCFKKLKGIASSKLHSLTPIAPILIISREDKRFTSSYDVTNDIDESSNLAAMDWEDFEHLIRELFEKEFSQNGGEVKVTKASRDGGVDAIAFDPDPIRGGKIVIQAKRYTNVVGVAAVRDLYGTVVNEGATKGILVTTSDYGPDSYEFAKGKPLTLLNGSNLLHLLEKHGHKAMIDVKAAKKLLSEREENSSD